MQTLSPGLTASSDHTVTDLDTAAVLGSGDLAVLGTPRLLAWAEAATCAAVATAVPDSQSTVGTRVSLEHRAASPVGAAVSVTATLRHVDGRRLVFEVVATHAGGTVVAHGEIVRVLVDRDRFLARLPSQ